jgi:hypothetical protein
VCVCVCVCVCVWCIRAALGQFIPESPEVAARELAQRTRDLEHASELAELAYRARDKTNLSNFFIGSLRFLLRVLLLPLFALPRFAQEFWLNHGVLWAVCCFVPLIVVYGRLTDSRALPCIAFGGGR